MNLLNRIRAAGAFSVLTRVFRPTARRVRARGLQVRISRLAGRVPSRGAPSPIQSQCEISGLGLADFQIGRASKMCEVRGFGNPRYSRLGSLRYRIACGLSWLAVGILLAGAETPPALPVVAMPVIPKHAVNLPDFGGRGDGKTLNTAAFEKAFAALAEQGGGKLVVPPGIWLTGPIKLRSRTELQLERGALIQFSGDYKLYPLAVMDMKGEQEVDSTSPISGVDLEGLAITGDGILDGGGNAWRPLKKDKLGDRDWKTSSNPAGC